VALIPSNKKTTEHIIEHKKFGGEKPRGYLGMSSLGNECLRAQWYSWHWAKFCKVSARINRLFKYGHNEEKHIIGDLKEAGMKVFLIKDRNEIEMTGEVGEEQEEITGFHHHCKGHPDGRVLGVIEAPKTVHLLEMKTMNDKNFSFLKEAIYKHGNEKGLKTAFPQYWDQMTRYMGGLDLKRGLFIATNKNDSARRYIRVHFNKKRFNMLVEREETIICSELPPTKKYRADHYKCAFCNYHQICHLGATPNENCRTCESVDLLPKGKWGCEKTGKRLSYNSQLRGCRKYKRMF